MNSLRPLVFPPLHRLVTPIAPRNRGFSLFGGRFGLQAVLALALLSALINGGAPGETLISWIFGVREATGFNLQSSVVIGLGAAAVAALLVTIGGVATASVRALTRTSPGPRT
jgi:hypothetical protein